MSHAEMKLACPRLNLENFDQIKRDGKDLISRTGATHLKIDLATVEFVDSSGLGALVALRKALGEGGQVTLANSNDFVLRVLKLTRLDEIFDLT